MSDSAVNASLVAELRQETGAGMMDCKKALMESGGDKEKALDYLRKKGIAAAEKRADRAAKEGLVACAVSGDGKTAALVEVNSETDFVARNDLFREFANATAKVILEWATANDKTNEDLLGMKLADGKKVGDHLTELVGKIGEKLAVGRFARIQIGKGVIGTYIHSDNKLGVLVALDGAEGPAVQALGKDLAMQIAAASPTVVRREEIPADKIEHERSIETERARAEGKPEAAISKIAEGRVNKWFAEVALLEQPFVKDPKVIIRDLVAEAGKTAGGMIEVKTFARIRIGS